MALVGVVGGNLIRKIHWNLFFAHTAADLNQLDFSAHVHWNTRNPFNFEFYASLLLKPPVSGSPYIFQLTVQ